MKVIYTLGIFNLISDSTHGDFPSYRVEANGVMLKTCTHDRCMDYIRALHETHEISQYVQNLRK